jgi:hypothetical protein
MNVKANFEIGFSLCWIYWLKGCETVRFQAMSQLDLTRTAPHLAVRRGELLHARHARGLEQVLPGHRHALFDEPVVRVGTPGCPIVYMDHTGCHQLVF